MINILTPALKLWWRLIVSAINEYASCQLELLFKPWIFSWASSCHVCRSWIRRQASGVAASFFRSSTRLKVVIRQIVLGHCTASHILHPATDLLTASAVFCLKVKAVWHSPSTLPANDFQTLLLSAQNKGLLRISLRSQDDSELQLTSKRTWQVASNWLKKKKKVVSLVDFSSVSWGASREEAFSLLSIKNFTIEVHCSRPRKYNNAHYHVITWLFSPFLGENELECNRGGATSTPEALGAPPADQWGNIIWVGFILPTVPSHASPNPPQRVNANVDQSMVHNQLKVQFNRLMQLSCFVLVSVHSLRSLCFMR